MRSTDSRCCVWNQVSEVQHFGNKHQSHEHGGVERQPGSRVQTSGEARVSFLSLPVVWHEEDVEAIIGSVWLISMSDITFSFSTQQLKEQKVAGNRTNEVRMFAKMFIYLWFLQMKVHPGSAWNIYFSNEQNVTKSPFTYKNVCFLHDLKAWPDKYRDSTSNEPTNNNRK